MYCSTGEVRCGAVRCAYVGLEVGMSRLGRSANNTKSPSVATAAASEGFWQLIAGLLPESCVRSCLFGRSRSSNLVLRCTALRDAVPLRSSAVVA